MKKLTAAEKRAIAIKHDWSCALCWNGGASRRFSKKERGRVFGGDHNPRLSDMAELAHRTEGRIEFLIVPIGVDEWAVKRALQKLQDKITSRPREFERKFKAQARKA